MIAAAMIAMYALSGQVEVGPSAFHRGVVDSDPVMDVIVTRASRAGLEQYRRQSRLMSPMDVWAVYELGTGVIRIDLRGWLPESDGAELEDLQGFSSNSALDAMRPVVPAAGTKFFYNGRAFEEQYPEDLAHSIIGTG